MEMLDGKKSYLLGLVVVVYGMYMGMANDMPVADVVDYLFGGSALVTVKSALAKLG